MEELIYGYIHQVKTGAPIQRQEIHLSNEYNVRLIKSDEDQIVGIDIEPIFDIYEKLYPSYVKNVNVLVGINGSGKTTIFNLLGSERNVRKGKISEWSFFWLYKVSDDEFVIEGNDLSVIRDINAFKKFIFQEGASAEYSFVFKYDFINQEITKIRWCCAGDWEQTKILYYKDRSPELFEWRTSRELGYTDLAVFVERKNIRPSFEKIYEYIQMVLESPFQERVGLINGSDLSISIYFNESFEFGCNWKNCNPKDVLKKYLIITAFYLIRYAFAGSITEENIKSVKELDAAMENDRFQYNDDWLAEVEKFFKKILNENSVEIASDLLYALERINETTAEISSFSFNDVVLDVNGIVFPIRTDDTNVIKEVLRLMDKVNEKSKNFYKMRLGRLSAGETKAVDTFSCISSNVDIVGKHYIVLLDEPDKGLHPEMSRKFLEKLLKHAGYLHKQYNVTFQFIISTHSPFLVSDVPKENIHCLRRTEEGVMISKSEMGLLSSIPDIMRNTFFLNSPFGAVANEYFHTLKQDIENLTPGNRFEQKKENIQKIIDSLDEPTIKMFLKNALDKKIEKNSTHLQLIKYHEKELKRLREEYND